MGPSSGIALRAGRADPARRLEGGTRAGPAPPLASRTRTALLALAFASGLVTLVYEVLWARELGRLFGSTAQATATTLAIFFTGLAAGSAFFGERIARHPRPVRTYALLELGIAAAAILQAGVPLLGGASLGLLDVYDRVYPALAGSLDGRPAALLALKLALSTALLLPASFCIGGTLPVLAEILASRGPRLAPAAAVLYATNTAGAALGALAAGFWLPLFPGVRASHLAAAGLNVALAAAALVLGRKQRNDGREALDEGDSDSRREGASTATRAFEEGRLEPSEHADQARTRALSADALPPVERAAARLDSRAVVGLAFLSGFTMLALEVLWTRMLALVLHNSVYSFTATLVGLLIALALGAAFAARLAHRATQPFVALVALLTFAGVTAGLSPFALEIWSGGFGDLGSGATWAAFLGSIFLAVAAVLALPATLGGAILPFLLRFAADAEGSPGRTFGRLAAVNTLGGVIGSLAAGFVLLPGLGLWTSIRTVAALSLAAAIALAVARRQIRLAAAPLVGLASLFTFADPARLPVARLDAAKGERLLDVWETPYGVVSALDRGSDRRLRIDNSYTLGGSAARAVESRQADLPLLLAESPRSVFFLGLGTGISAGAVLAHPVERLTTVELIAEVARASMLYFADSTHGLFTDPRSRVWIGDGRAILRSSEERWDVVISDLFVPWHAGTASLYGRDHFAAVREHLAPGGLFAQWLPLYQLSRRELEIVVRTMLDVFPRVTLWRGDFSTSRPIVALIGQDAGAELDPERVVARVRALGRSGNEDDETILALEVLAYAGDLTAARELFAEAPIHTDDRPILEHLAAMTQARSTAGDTPWLVGAELARFQDEVLAAAEPEADPYLARLAPDEKGFVRAGAALFRALVALRGGRPDVARAEREAFESRVPASVAAHFAGRFERPAEALRRRAARDAEQVTARGRTAREVVPRGLMDSAFDPARSSAPAWRVGLVSGPEAQQ